MKLRKHFLLLIIVLISGTPFSCAIFNQKYLENEKIHINEKDVFTYEMRLGRTVNNFTDFQFKIFSGIDTLVKIKTQEESILILKIASDVKEGEFRLILVNSEKEITHLIRQSGSYHQEILLPIGLSRIRIVGKKTSGVLQMKIDGDGEFDYKR